MPFILVVDPCKSGRNGSKIAKDFFIVDKNLKDDSFCMLFFSVFVCSQG